ncbi:DUF3307 domain-containing protein [Natronobacterium gregoryi]|uniref:DUF3307 domain-containing protein n=2 Tax=Natronobacterium gregoryi TaxID=44930 RepID=L0AL77_NATGS|nr:DUF3307 domain-containing protein [Natronobacterium gregoryi]AFZ74551.1 Protein of unknown function (DUF3307) [Natronobacterium gregoryi SP2]ELY72378.1 hypothetical protein C490_03503 [Natronobacterium gregoryi SP2]PLK21706.1 DUF3307 domain-containing protein [Natronobacterium gregoryi SP2]SFI96415.1 Protein of unknown function [Natronobacterium gregoryi]
MALETLGALLLAHFVADYPLQTDWMAANKHSDRKALALHAYVHGFAVLLFLPLATSSGLVIAGASAYVVAVHGTIDAFDFHIRWDQTAHLLSIVAVAVLVALV